MRISGVTQMHTTDCTLYGVLQCGDGVAVSRIPVMVTSIRLPATGSPQNVILEIDAEEVEYFWIILRNKKNGGNIESRITSKDDDSEINPGEGARVNDICVEVIGKVWSEGAESATIFAKEV